MLLGTLTLDTVLTSVWTGQAPAAGEAPDESGWCWRLEVLGLGAQERGAGGVWVGHQQCLARSLLGACCVHKALI